MIILKIGMSKQNANSIKMRNKKGEARYASELRKILLETDCLKGKDFPLYFIFRGIKKEKEIRYDITIIPPKMLGKEFVKTKGHFHLGKYGELYKVLSGKGIFLLQKGKNKVEDVYFVEAKSGNYVLIPPDYGHVTINPGKKILKIANWVSENCLSDYQTVEKKKGMCYYYTIEGWVKNKKYTKVPQLKEKKPLSKKPRNLNFLYAKE